MTTRPNLNQLSKEVFEANKAKGFHDREWRNEHLLMLVICELSEAIEADRKGKIADIGIYQHSCEIWKKYYPTKENMLFTQDFETYIKDTIEDELADALIRLLDLAGLRRFEIVERNLQKLENVQSLLESIYTEITFAELLFATTAIITDTKCCVEDRVNTAIGNIESICRYLSIDLWLHVELKLKYNKTRPFKHGKKY